MQRYLVKKCHVYSNDSDYFIQMHPRENGGKRSEKWMKKIGGRMKITLSSETGDKGKM